MFYWRLAIKKSTHFATSDDLPKIRDNAFNETLEEWVKDGRDVSELDFDVKLDVDLSL